MAEPNMMLTGLEQFDCNSELSSLGTRWEKWRRALEIYLIAASITQPIKKRAILLHFGGLSLQEVYYNLPGAHVDEADDIDVFEVALEKLNQYFFPKQSKIYERHLFRLIKQDEGERFESFLLRLRNQAEKCGFTDKNENLIDQITEKCCSSKLRKKVLEIGDEITFDKIVAEANTLEIVGKQLEKMERNDTFNANKAINKIDDRTVEKYKKIASSESSGNKCSRCGSNKHSSHDNNCPAMGKKCLKCGFMNHFQEFCQSTRKRKFMNYNKTHFKAKISKLEQTKSKSDQVDYIF